MRKTVVHFITDGMYRLKDILFWNLSHLGVFQVDYAYSWALYSELIVGAQYISHNIIHKCEIKCWLEMNLRVLRAVDDVSLAHCMWSLQDR